MIFLPNISHFEFRIQHKIMESFLEHFVEAGKGSDYRRMDDLQQNVPYKILKFTLRQSSFNKAAKVLEGFIEDPRTMETFTLYFPERLAKKIRTDDELEKLNEQNFNFIFKGRENRAAILDFFKH